MRRRSREKQFLKAFLLLSIAFCSIIGIFVGWYSLAALSACPNETSGEYLRLPPSVISVDRHYQFRSRSCTVWIKFQLPPQDLDTFVASTFIKMPLSAQKPSDYNDFIRYIEENTNWQMSQIPTLLTGEGDGTGNHNLDDQFIAVDTTNPNQYTVYLQTTRNWL